MNEFQIDTIRNLVYTIGNKAGITNTNELDNVAREISNLNVNDAIDRILVSLSDLVRREAITVHDVYECVDSIIALNPDKYHDTKDLMARLDWIKAMNLEHPAMPLTENHELVIETFDKFNQIIQGRFDAYYTGGLMGYLVTGRELERYHGDLDLFINEEQLEMLKQVIDLSEDFKMESNMDHKEVNGHEYKITYKDTPMSVGLFLFARKPDQSIVQKEYYYDEAGQLLVDENHFTKDYTDMCFSNMVREHNGAYYRMMSLESIFNSKKASRPKDRYDAGIIEEYVDMDKDRAIDMAKPNNTKVKGKVADSRIIDNMEALIGAERGSR